MTPVIDTMKIEFQEISFNKKGFKAHAQFIKTYDDGNSYLWKEMLIILDKAEVGQWLG